MAIATLTIDINAKLANIEQDLGRVSHLAEQSGMRMASAFDLAKKSIIGFVGFQSLQSIINFGQQSLQSAQEAEQASNRMIAALKATGYSAGLAKSSLDELADSLAQSTQFDDESIRNAESAFLKFGNIQDGVFQKGIKLSADLAAFLGTDVADAAQTVGKALSSPTEGLRSLEMQIGKLSEGQKNLIKSYAEAGDMAKAQAAVLDLLQSKIGGTAELMNTGLTKSTNDTKKAWGELQEAIGKTSLIGGSAQAALGSLTSYLEDMKRVIEDGDWLDKLAFFSIGMTTPSMQKGNQWNGSVGSASERNRLAKAAEDARYSADTDQFWSDTDKRNEAQKKANEAAAKKAASERERLAKAAEDARYASARAGSEDMAKLFTNFGDAAAPDQSVSEKLQAQLDAYRALDPAVKTYLQGLVDSVKANEDLATSLDSVNSMMDATQQYDDMASQQYQSFSDAYTKILQETEDINASMIASDEKRAQRQLEIEHNRRVERISLMEGEQDDIQQLLDAENERFEAAGKALETRAKDTKNFGKEIGMTFSSAFEDAVTGGKKLGDVLKSLAQDIEKLILRKTITDPLMKGVSNWFDNLDFGSWFKNADGGIYSGAGISAYSGSVVSSPTVFPFAKGVGLMGEAGPEAILPLTRVNGKLGVQASGSQGGSSMTVNVINNAPVQVSSTQPRSDGNGGMTLDVIIEPIKSALIRDMSRGGDFGSAIENQYGLNRAAGATR